MITKTNIKIKVNKHKQIIINKKSAPTSLHQAAPGRRQPGAR